MENVDTRIIERRGRKLLLNENLISRLCDEITAGMPETKAAAMVGISKASYFGWKRKALEIDPGSVQEGEEIYLELLDRVEKAQAEFVKKAVISIAQEGPSGYRWLLARLFRKEFGDEAATLPMTGVLQLQLPGMIEPENEEQPALTDTISIS